MSIRIPPPPAIPRDAALDVWLQSLYAELTRLDKEARKLQRDVEIARTERLILSDEVGARYSVTVNSTGPSVVATILP